jgi:hypothetical protein
MQRSRTQESASSSLPEYGSPREVYKAKTASRSLDGTSKETSGRYTDHGPQQTARAGGHEDDQAPPTPSPRITVVNLRAGTRQGLPMLAAGTSKVSPSQAGAAPHCSNVAGF